MEETAGLASKFSVESSRYKEIIEKLLEANMMDSLL